MSQENVELVRRGIEVINRGEVDAILAFVDEVADPEVEFRAVGRLPDTRKVQRGPDAVKAWWAQLLEAFDWKLEADELIDAGDAVVVIARQKGRGRESGAEVTDRTIQVFGFREGKVTYIDAYRTEREALEAAGLKD